MGAPNDRILQVNGLAGDHSRLRQEIATCTTKVRLLIGRPERVYVTVQNRDDGPGPWGLGYSRVLCASRESALKITKITDGKPLGKWNKDNPDMAIQVGDVIIEVNAIKDDAEKMEQACKGC